jgi:Flp pilus assembly protein TadB
MEDRVPIEALEEPSAASDSLENRRKAIREEAGIAILLGGVIVLLHLILLCLGVLELRDISGSLIFIILLIIGFAVLLEGVLGLRRARNLSGRIGERRSATWRVVAIADERHASR